MFFKEIPGQADIKQFLHHIAGKERVPHAMLFSGEAGRGTLPLVRAFTSLLFCKSPEGGESCGKCSNCMKTHKLSHPDVHYSFPVQGSKNVAADFMESWRELMMESPFSSINDWQLIATDNRKQLNLNVKEIGEILEFASLKSYEGGKKVLIIWMAEQLEKEGNRILKLIEEPPQGMFIFLLTENEDRILNTIHSRCQSLVVKPLKDEEISSFLINEFQLNKEKAQKIAFQADGDVNTALSLMNEQRNDWLREFVDWLRACYRLKPHDLYDRTIQFSKLNREEQKQFLEVGLTALESIVMAKYTSDRKVRLSKEDVKPITNLAKLLEFDQIEQMSDIINISIADIEQNINSKVLFMRQSVNIHRIMHRAS